MLLRADLGELDSASETFGGGLVIPELSLQFAHDGVEKMVRRSRY